ncbi:hypothetical protein Hanom_Chr15g01387071 [Helianthus anomalus]
MTSRLTTKKDSSLTNLRKPLTSWRRRHIKAVQAFIIIKESLSALLAMTGRA